MEKLLEIGKWILANYETILGNVSVILAAVIAISLLIPGEQPEKFLQKVLDFIKKFSKKPSK